MVIHFKRVTSIVIAAGVVLLTGTLTGCAPKVSYGNAQAVETVNVDFGSTDLQKIAQKMTDSLLDSGFVNKLANEHRSPVLYVDGINNKTDEHIDTQSITDSITNKLLSSGKFQFVDMNKVNQVRKQLNYQNNSGMVAPNKAIDFGHQVGAQYMIYGNLSSIIKTNSSTKDVYYKMTMRLMDLRSGLLVWSNETQIRKDEKHSLLGW